ncbi:MAG: 23S rRNA (guanosine(2251)-2'-O)-methyltransferase RlmB [Gammaproteobacteria bacterium]|jgi:23S rRNA (guanosine2251-2'-O)-methyltransferase|nr:23S rRNA (guanosine(2251)-2'-O)-methyltransferase RlmB [Gammaproteobacteria bacterium]
MKGGFRPPRDAGKPRREGAMLCGIHAVSGLLRRRPAAIRAIWLQEGSRNSRLVELGEQAERSAVRCRVAPVEELDRLAEGVRHQGVIAQFDAEALTLNEAELDQLLDGVEGAPLLLVLDGVQDPHNLGACLRTADAAGVHAVIAPRDRAASLTATVCKVASGAAGKVPFVQVTNLARTLRGLRDRGIWIAGADAEAGASLYGLELDGPLALVLGAEDRGLRRLTREHCDWLVAIPMAGEAGVESLNVSVAAGICLFEVRRQRLARSA